MKAFLVRGSFRMDRGWTKFTKEVAADGPDSAVEHVLSDLGSKHRVRRNYVRIRDVTPLAEDQVTDPVVRFRLEANP